MKQITAKQYVKIHPVLPVQRGNVRIPNIVFINAVLYVSENGCKWRALPEHFEKWQTVYAWFRRWSRSGVLKRLFAALWEQKATGEDAPLAMDLAYEGDETRQLVCDLGMTPVVPPKANRKVKWNYDRETYKRRNEIEQLFWRFKGYRRIFTRFDKLDATYLGFVSLAAAVEMMYDLV